MTRIAIIADDLTGALDAASPFACKGAHAICLTNPEAISPAALNLADVVSVTTNSRHHEPWIAANIAQRAALQLRLWKPDIILKKVDSRLKGNVAEESSAVATVFGRDRLLVSPAAPDIGRVVKNKELTGHGVGQPIRVADRFSASTVALDVPDVDSKQDMLAVAREVIGDERRLAVCSRGLAVALAELLFPGEADEPVKLDGPALVAIGSRDPVTATQVEKLCAANRFACVAANDGHVPKSLPEASELLLFCTGDLKESADLVAQRFATGLKQIIAQVMPKTVLLSGGDTALALLRNYGESVLRVDGEVAAGLPVFRVQLGGLSIMMISKSGGIGSPETLLDIFRCA